jgi:adenylylsulfate kinase-like enzyme
VSISEGEFIEIFVDTPLVEAEKGEMKGIYKKARRTQALHRTSIRLIRYRSAMKSGSIPPAQHRTRAVELIANAGNLIEAG